MTKLGLWLVAVSMATATAAFAQRDAPVRANVTELQRIATSAEKDYKANRAEALRLAKRYDWIVERTYADGTHISLQGLDSKGMPIYYITYNNTRAAATTKTDQLWAGGSLGLSLGGAGTAVAEKLGMWDGGGIRVTHQELKDRVVQKDKPSETSSHATHVAGTMVASGVNPLAKGMAHSVKKLMAYDFNNDVAEMALAAKDLLVSNHSYGSIAGWRYNPERKGTSEDPYWEWWGDTEISGTEDYKFGYYDENTASWDRISYNAPYFLIVKSVGNNRVEGGPAVGEPYFQRNSSGKFNLVSSRSSNMSSNNAYDIIPTYGNAKNILTVGAVSPISEGYNKPSDVVAASFSSFGPTDDGRIKPDLVGNGVSVLSTTDASNSSYGFSSGTSMASPNVAGTLLLLQEHYDNLNSGKAMRAATLKALAIHTADEAGEAPGPDYMFGWGLLNAERAATVISNTGGRHLIQENTLEQGQAYSFDVTASGAGPLVITIAWTDPEAAVAPVGIQALNNRTPRLVNDLDVRVTGRGKTYQPWKLDPTNPAAAATQGDNALDNVEQIAIADAVPGASYTIAVTHKGTLSKGPQAYAMIVSGAGGTAACASAATSDAGARINKITVGTQAITLPAGCTTYRDQTGSIFAFEPGQSKPVALELGSCTADAAKVAKVFIDWNGNSSFADAGEEVAVSGILNGNATFNTTITAPTSAPVGHKVRMRVVVQEASGAGGVNACGTYTRGETQDYLVQFAKPQRDIGIMSVKPLGSSLCATPNQSVAVMIRNHGAAAQANIPVAISIRKDGTEVKRLMGTFAGELAPFAQAELVLEDNFATEAGATYELVALSELQGDVLENNNRMVRAFTATGNASPPTEAAAFRCGTSPNLTLSGQGSGTIFWYNSATGTQPIAAGNQLQLVTSGQTIDKLYAALNDFKGTVGPANKDFAFGGGYNQFSPDVLVSAKAPMMLESARLYIGHSGKITFTVFNSDGAPVSTRTLYVTATRTTPAPGPQPNDPADQGAVYYLGLEIPAAGDYRIAIAYENGATIFRNNEGVRGYPFQIPNIFGIVGNTATTTPDAYYYYFYDLKVRALGCPSERVEAVMNQGIPLAQPVITRNGQSIVSSAPEGNQWYFNGKPIEGALGQDFAPTQSGEYSVIVFKDGCISEMSVPYTFSYKPDIRELGTDLVVSPNPSTGRFRIELETSQPEDITFEVSDMLGKLIYSAKAEKHNGQYEGFINLSAHASGLYMLRVRHGDKSFTQKLLVQH
ncbi:MAG: S8 family serine peptidase [Hymenobacteraceae bacterium]|nr:S8 family serine peptidase [Hymenobacteraceae bacterium]